MVLLIILTAPFSYADDAWIRREENRVLRSIHGNVPDMFDGEDDIDTMEVHEVQRPVYQSTPAGILCGIGFSYTLLYACLISACIDTSVASEDVCCLLSFGTRVT